jgi:hypothetical protein
LNLEREKFVPGKVESDNEGFASIVGISDLNG